MLLFLETLSELRHILHVTEKHIDFLKVLLRHHREYNPSADEKAAWVGEIAEPTSDVITENGGLTTLYKRIKIVKKMPLKPVERMRN